MKCRRYDDVTDATVATMVCGGTAGRFLEGQVDDFVRKSTKWSYRSEKDGGQARMTMRVRRLQ